MNSKKIAFFAVGPIVSALLGLITLPIITWFFSQEDIGRIAMLQIAVGFSTLLFSLGLDQAYVREFHEVKDRSSLIQRAIMPGFVLLSFTLATLLFFGGCLAEWLFDVPDHALSLMIVIVLLTAFISRFLSLVLRMNERGLAFSMSQVLPKLLLVCIVGTYVLFEIDKTLNNLVLAYTAAFLIVCVVFAWNTRREWLSGLGGAFDIPHLKIMLKFGAPLIVGGLAFWGLVAIDKIFIRVFSTFEELGIYSVSVSFAAAGIVLQSVFSTVWVPTVYKWSSEGIEIENVHRVIRYVLALVIILFSIAGLFSWVVSTFLPAKYSAVQWIVVSCLGYPLLYTLSESTAVGIGISRRSWYAMISAVFSLMINLLGNWLLIPKYGASGAAVSTCISFWIYLLLRTEFSIKLWKPQPRLLLYGYTFVIVAGASTFTLFGKFITIYMRFFWLFILFSVFFSFKDELKKTWAYIVN